MGYSATSSVKMLSAKRSLFHFLKPVTSPCLNITLVLVYQQPQPWEGIILWLCPPCCAPAQPSAGAGSSPGSKRPCHRTVLTAQTHPSLSLGPGHTKPVEKCAPLSFPEPQGTALCSDTLIYTKQALLLSTKLGRWCQVVPAQRLELRPFQW